MGGFTLKKDEKKYQLIPEGVHHAICIGLYDLGTHFDQTFGKWNRKCLITWELPDSRIEFEKDGQQQSFPQTISKQFTVSFNEKSNLFKILVSWRGKAFTDQELEGFDFTSILGANCMMQIMHTKKDDKEYANIVTITPLYKGMPKRDPEGTINLYSMDRLEYEATPSIPEMVPAWIKEIILKSKEHQEVPAKKEGDVPF